jgi:hypothetical protein
VDQANDTFACPHCDRRFGYKPELEGKSVRCKCGEKFTIEAPIPDDEPDAYELDHDTPEDNGPDYSALLGASGTAATPVAAAANVCPGCGAVVKPGAAICVRCGTDLKSGKSRGETRVTEDTDSAHEPEASASRMKITGVGLGIHTLGMFILTGSIIMALLGMLLGKMDYPMGGIVVVASVVMAILGIPITLLGSSMSIAAPADAGRVWLLSSIFCLLGGLVVFGMTLADVLPEWMMAGLNIPFLISAGCFMGFLQKLSNYIDDDWLYNRTSLMIKICLGLIPLSLAIFIPLVDFYAAITAVICDAAFLIVYAGTTVYATRAAFVSGST